MGRMRVDELNGKDGSQKNFMPYAVGKQPSMPLINLGKNGH